MTERITTPASSARRPTVVVLGGGIAGLTAAHELAERGFEVTVYEPRRDERSGLGTYPEGAIPPVKLGGLAASQYSTVGAHGGSPAELRPFPGRRGQPPVPAREVAGEHGFRFFPAYYLHTWDMFQRIPTYERVGSEGGGVGWQPTSRTVMDNVRRVITQGTTVEGQASLVFPREAPRTPFEFLSILGQLTKLGFTPLDISTFLGRILRYLSTSPLRRARELQNLSAYDYFVGRNNADEPRTVSYSPRFDAYLLEMPRVLAAFDTRWGDARTNLTTYLQLQLQMDRRDNKADGVLNGPTTESWFDHWYRHLVALGVRFVNGAVERIDPLPADPALPPYLRPRIQITLADGTRLNPDYAVVAVDAPAAERITAPMRAAAAGGTVVELDGFTTSVPPPNGPLEPTTNRAGARRDPYAMDELGRVPWDRFQTLAGIQFYFDTEFQLLRGHVYYSGTEWALSSINQHGMWERRPSLPRDGHVAVLSVDIGDFNTPSRHLVDEFGRGKAARDCTADEIATEVWRQVVTALTSDVDNVPEALLPWPSWYALDRGLVMAGGSGQGAGRPIRNETPYLVPIVGDWNNRPGAEPWNPHNTSLREIPPEDVWLAELELRNVWQARHGGYQVHNNSVVFAGTWTRTFTRMTSMEAAGESARHAVNAILDHYVWVESGGLDVRETTSLAWQFPFGFLDQGYSSPIRMPSPAGDYCYVFDIENREPAETRLLRMLDSRYCEQSLPHPLDSPTAMPVGTPTSPVPPPAGGQPMTSPMDFQQLLAYMQIWRQLLEQTTNVVPGLPFPAFPTPGAPLVPPVVTSSPMPPTGAFGPPPGLNAMPPAPADYAQQLFGYLQAWRHYLEQSAGPAGPLAQPTTQPPLPTLPPQPPLPPTQPQMPTQPNQQQSGSTPQPSPVPQQSNGGTTIPPKIVLANALDQFGNQLPIEGSLDREALLEQRAPLRRPITELGSRGNFQSLFGRSADTSVTTQAAASDAGANSMTSRAQLGRAIDETQSDIAIPGSHFGLRGADGARASHSLMTPSAVPGTPRQASQRPAAHVRTAFSGLADRVAPAPRTDGELGSAH
jgi:FAD dependent oxidoreductase